MTVGDLQREVLAFSQSRDWIQYHNPRSLAEAIVIEAAELLEAFQWKRDEACEVAALDGPSRQAIESELADVLIYSLNLANALGVDAGAVVKRKLFENELRFPR